MQQNIEKILINSASIEERMSILAEEINNKYKGKELVVVMLLKGAMIFTADICRQLTMPLQIECLNVSSYHGNTTSSGTVNFLDRELPNLTGKHVLLVDDILDTGLTLAAVSKEIQTLDTESLETCVLLSKNKTRTEDVSADYTGFEIADEFVVGYGLDYKGLYRNLPYIGVLKESAI